MVIQSKMKLENMQAEWKNEVTDKMCGHTYDSGMAEERKEAPARTPSTKKSKSEAICKKCKNYGHQRVSSSLCRANPKSPYYEGTTGTCVVFVLSVYSVRFTTMYSYLASEHTSTNPS